jgi:hypothetical protein
MALYCSSCDMPHDIDLSPDTGECIACGGPLIEDETERGQVGPSVQAAKLVTAVNDGLLGIAIASGKASRGVN